LLTAKLRHLTTIWPVRRISSTTRASLDGVSGLVAALTALAQAGITMKYDKIGQVVADGDFAYVRLKVWYEGQPYVSMTCSGSRTGGAASTGMSWFRRANSTTC